MLALRSLAKRSPQFAAKALSQQRTIVSGPPTVRISFAEKCMHGVGLGIGILAVPLYILLNLRIYNRTADKE